MKKSEMKVGEHYRYKYKAGRKWGVSVEAILLSIATGQYGRVSGEVETDIGTIAFKDKSGYDHVIAMLDGNGGYRVASASSAQLVSTWKQWIEVDKPAIEAKEEAKKAEEDARLAEATKVHKQIIAHANVLGVSAEDNGSNLYARFARVPTTVTISVEDFLRLKV